MVGLTSERDRFEIGRVLRRTVEALKLNLTNFIVLTLILVAAPKLVETLLQVLVVPHGAGAHPFLPATWAWTLALSVIALYLSCAAQGAILRSAIEGRRTELGYMLTAGLRMGLPLLGLTILATIAMAIGFVLLLVPGVILAILWVATGPVVVMEGTGVFGSFGRSAALTRGSRWRLFLLGLLYIVAMAILGVIVLAPFGFGASLMHTAALSAGLIVYALVASLFSLVLVVIQTVLIASVYSELRLIREGVAPEGVAQAFD